MMRRILLTVLAAFLATLSFAQEKSAAQLKAELVGFGRRIAALECDFIQTKESSLFAEKMVSVGKMSYRKPDCLEWSYLKPFELSFTVNGNEVSVRKDGESVPAQGGRDKMIREMVRMVQGCIEGGYLSDSSLFKTDVSVVDGLVCVELVPENRELKRMWTRMVLKYDLKDLGAKSFEMQELSGDITVITFRNCRYDFSE